MGVERFPASQIRFERSYAKRNARTVGMHSFTWAGFVIVGHRLTMRLIVSLGFAKDAGFGTTDIM